MNILSFFKKKWVSILKSFSLLLIITYSACLLGANIGYYKYNSNEKWFFPKVNFGIDIVGGNQLTVAIDSSEVVKEFLDTVYDDIENSCKQQNLQCKITKKNNLFYTDVDVGNVEKKNKDILLNFRKSLSQEYLDLDVLKNNNEKLTFSVEITDKIKDRIIMDTTDKAISILKNRIDGVGVKEISVQRYGSDKIVILVPQSVNIERIKNIVNTTAKLTFNLMDKHHIFYEKPKEILSKHIIAEQYKTSGNGLYYVIEEKPSLKGDCMSKVQATNNGFEVAINFSMNYNCGKTFGDITRNNIGRLLAIVLDGRVLMAPMINVPILDGNGSITGGFSMQEANDLSVLLRSGSLPAKTTIINDRHLSSVFDKNIFSSASNSIFIAFILLSLVMLLRYRYLGFVAIFALGLNFLLTFSIISVLGFTLTLPGIAGLVLMLGMAIDANILIYEKMKELKKQGITPIQNIIKNGFSKALNTIIDSNLTTIIAGIALFSFGGSFIKGFSITLIIGILCSLFTAVNFSKIIITMNYRNKKNISGL
jgi:preprotein translocase subunit SecD